MLISTIREQQKTALWLIPAIIAVLAVVPSIVPTSATLTLIAVLMYANLTLAWTMFSGPTGNISLATAALFGVGTYATALLRGTMPIELIVLIGATAAFVLAFGIGLLTLRLRGVYFILFTFGLTALIGNSVQWLETHVGRTVGRHVAGATTEAVYLLVLIIFSAVLVTSFLLRSSSAGLALRGLGENQDAAVHVGVNATRLKVLTFALSGLFMGATGAVMATHWRYIDPSIAFNPLLSFLPVVMAIFGGISRLYGPLLGTVVLVVLRELLITSYPYVYMLLFGVTLVVVVLWLPGGLVSLVERWSGRGNVWRTKLTMRIAQWRDR
jgi:branched-chain amino acid transport system permease protein